MQGEPVPYGSVCRVSLPYIVLAGLLGMTAADFLSGLVHWAGKRISGYCF